MLTGPLPVPGRGGARRRSRRHAVGRGRRGGAVNGGAVVALGKNLSLGLEFRSGLQAFSRFLRGQLDLAVLRVLRNRHAFEGNGDVLFADAEEATDADHGCFDCAILLEDQVVDLADAFIRGVVDGLADIGGRSNLVHGLLGQVARRCGGSRGAGGRHFGRRVVIVPLVPSEPCIGWVSMVWGRGSVLCESKRGQRGDACKQGAGRDGSDKLVVMG